MVMPMRPLEPRVQVARRPRHTAPVGPSVRHTCTVEKVMVTQSTSAVRPQATETGRGLPTKWARSIATPVLTHRGFDPDDPAQPAKLTTTIEARTALRIPGSLERRLGERSLA